jgi:purine-binding chemotaxis protein CheW
VSGRDERDERDERLAPLGLAAALRKAESAPAGDAEGAGATDARPADGEASAPAPRVPLRERLRAREEGVELLLFRVGRDPFATDLLAVEEAVELGDVHPVPGAPPAMLGVLGLRGRLLPVYSPEHALGLPARSRPGQYVLVVRAPGEPDDARPVAVVVDDVEDVHRADMAAVQDPGAAGGQAGEAAGAAHGASAALDVVLGVLHWRGEIVALVDPDALVAACVEADEGQTRDARGEETA